MVLIFDIFDFQVNKYESGFFNRQDDNDLYNGFVSFNLEELGIDNYNEMSLGEIIYLYEKFLIFCKKKEWNYFSNLYIPLLNNYSVDKEIKTESPPIIYIFLEKKNVTFLGKDVLSQKIYTNSKIKAKYLVREVDEGMEEQGILLESEGTH